METFKKISPIYIGAVIAFISLLIAQIKMDGLLPAKLYLVVAIVSCNLVMIDLLKTFSRTITRCEKIIDELDSIYLENQSVFSVSESNDSDSNRFVHKYSKKVENHQKKGHRTNNIIKKIADVMVYISYTVIVFIVITVPFKMIPDNLLTNKYIGIITLFTFVITISLLGINHYLDSYEEKSSQEVADIKNAVQAVKALRKCDDEYDNSGE